MKEHFDTIVSLMDILEIPYVDASQYGGYAYVTIRDGCGFYVYDDSLSFWVGYDNRRFPSTDIQQLLELISDSRT